MTTVAPQPDPDLMVDAAVVGGGAAGLATAAHLARRGKRVVCVEHRGWPRPAVGESLEFSAPGLLDALGVEIEGGHEQSRHLYPKTSVRIHGHDEEFTVWPPGWFARAPIWCSGRTFHTDRRELDQQLLHLAVDEGAAILPERVTSVEHENDRVVALTTDQRTRIEASWFVDATGHTCRLFGRALGLDTVLLGQPRAAYWARIDEPPEGHATSLYFPEPAAPDLTWAWQIPLNASEVSIGIVMSTGRVRGLRRRGYGPHEIFSRQLEAIPGLRRIAHEHRCVELHTATYTPYRHRRPIGPNWLLVGDASAMVDPLTSNGVTSALRHADRAARIVCDALDHTDLERGQAWAYRTTVPVAVTTIEAAIEAFLYQPAVRQRLGLAAAVNLYAATGVITNALYTKLQPVGVRRSLVCAVMLAASRLWTRLASKVLGLDGRPGANGKGPGERG